ncbi:methyltransferase domain-containing protein [uncultured Bacteroides sp.]|uniref:class I SAM-dependent methyltransferase n=1 Tax=uncultured Bacteroides sp. TaxID=162156 RepID=UPI002AABDBB6|nr:methyltransferase domain-containing protein [uncultured Bacteroides sp.]
MQKRQKNRELYFTELSITSEKYFIPYVSDYKKIEAGMNILEVGCGDGGNLLPFSEMGCHTIGVDMSEGRIKDAILFFKKSNAKGDFIASDIFKLKELEYKFDLIICHDVIEHIENKSLFLKNLKRYLKSGGIIFMSFPAWQMPFGGHQQICQSPIISHFPFLHLLPCSIYKAILKLNGESQGCIKELLEIKQTRTSIELFERVAKQEELLITNRTLFFINPHYEIKFGLKPKKLLHFFSYIPHVRNYFTTSCFYILNPQKEQIDESFAVTN